MPCSCDSSCRSRPSCSEPVPASPLPGGMRCRTLALGECGDGILPCNRSRMKKSDEKICGFQKWLYLCTRNTERGALVQLVRIRACHARGQGFESPTHRRRRNETVTATVSFSIYSNRAGCVITKVSLFKNFRVKFQLSFESIHSADWIRITVQPRILQDIRGCKA